MAIEKATLCHSQAYTCFFIPSSVSVDPGLYLNQAVKATQLPNYPEWTIVQLLCNIVLEDFGV